MKSTVVALVLFALLACGGPFGPAHLSADDPPADVSTIKSLSPDQARKLVAGYSMAEVEIVIKGRGVFKSDLVLPLNGLERLDAETAKVLATFGGEVLSLGGLQALDAATAGALAQFQGDIFLHGLTRLDAATAAALAQCKGDYLLLPGLETLDAATARSLVGFGRGYLYLEGLETLDAETAAVLAAFTGHGIHLGLTRIDAPLAKTLSTGKFPELYLGGPARLAPDIARTLATFKGQALALKGLATLDAETAAALAEFKGSMLHLAGLTALDAASATALARFHDTLVLSGLAEIDAGAAKALAECRGPSFYIHGLTRLDAATAKALAGSQKWTGQLPNVTVLDAPDSVDVAKALATRKGQLLLENLRKVSPRTLTALLAKRDVTIPAIDRLEFIAEPDGGASEDFVIPEWLVERERLSGAKEAANPD